MPDIKKVIKGLEICYCPPTKCEDCPYHNLPNEQSCNDILCLDALALLKEQEEQIKNRDESLEKAREEIKWLREMPEEETLESKLIECLIVRPDQELGPNQRKLVKRAIRALQYEIFKERGDAS